MSRHLDDEQIAAAVALVELEEQAALHLGACLACRAEVRKMQDLLAGQRQALEEEAPDWQRQHREIMGRLPAPVVPIRRRRWLRSVAALAATAVVAVGVAVLVDHHPAPRPEVDLEQVLAAVDSMLEDRGVPGFEAFYALDGEETLVAELDGEWDEDIPGFEALESMVPGFEDIQGLIGGDSMS